MACTHRSPGFFDRDFFLSGTIFAGFDVCAATFRRQVLSWTCRPNATLVRQILRHHLRKLRKQCSSVTPRFSIRSWPLGSNQNDWRLRCFSLDSGLWFSWQHGYDNSPDSWYRGVLANSISEGHPYFINLRQGWLYDYPAWHRMRRTALPASYMPCTLIFRPQISISNVVVSLSAGLLVLPVLRLSRMLTGAPIAGLVVYLALAFNDKADFLFEVFSGLSIPVAVVLLATVFYFILRLASTGALPDLAGGVLALAVSLRPSGRATDFRLAHAMGTNPRIPIRRAAVSGADVGNCVPACAALGAKKFRAAGQSVFYRYVAGTLERPRL
jgi:hypothetical protein